MRVGEGSGMRTGVNMDLESEAPCRGPPPCTSKGYLVESLLEDDPSPLDSTDRTVLGSASDLKVRIYLIYI